MTTLPSELSPYFIERFCSSAGQHHGLFQILDFHEKKNGIYSARVSDGHFQIKVLANQKAAAAMINDELRPNDIVSGAIFNYSMEDNIYLFRQIFNSWRIDTVIGTPVNWKPKKVNINKNGSNKIIWPVEEEKQPEQSPPPSKENVSKSLDLVANLYDDIIPEQSEKESEINTKDNQPPMKTPNVQPIETTQSVTNFKPTLPSFSPNSASLPNQQEDEDMEELMSLISLNKKSKSTSSQLIDSEPRHTQCQSEQRDRKEDNSKNICRPVMQQEKAPSKLEYDQEDDMEQLELLLGIHKQKSNSIVSMSKRSSNQEESKTRIRQWLDSNSNKSFQQPQQHQTEPIVQQVPVRQEHSNKYDSQDDQLEELLAMHKKSNTRKDEKVDKLEIVTPKVSQKKEKPVAVRSRLENYFQVDIAQLSPDLAGRWKIRVRVLAKSKEVTKKVFGNKTITSFLCYLRDKQGSIIQATVLQGAHFSKLQEDGYYVLGGSMQVKQGRSLRHKGTVLTMQITSATIIQPDDLENEGYQVNLARDYTDIKLIHSKAESEFLVNVVGIVKSVKLSSYFKDNQKKQKITAIIVNPLTCSEIQINDFSSSFDAKQLQIVVLFGAKVSKFKDQKNLMVGFTTLIRSSFEHNNKSNTSPTQSSSVCQCSVPQTHRLIPYTTREAVENMKIVYDMEPRPFHKLVMLFNTSPEGTDLSCSVKCRIESIFKQNNTYFVCSECQRKIQCIGSDLKAHCGTCGKQKELQVKFSITGRISAESGSMYVSFDEEVIYQHMLERSITALRVFQEGIRGQGGHGVSLMTEFFTQLDKVVGKLWNMQLLGGVTTFKGRRYASLRVVKMEPVRAASILESMLTQVTFYTTIL